MPLSTNEEDKIVKEALRLIDQGWAQLQSQSQNSSYSKTSVIFVLGGTGAGKSTVTQVTTGNLANIYSRPGQHGTGLVIVDQVGSGNNGESRIGDPQVASKTFLPEYLVCEDDPTLVFVDCPGFNDNRGPDMDIAAMVLIRKIAENVEQARFLFLIPASSVSYSSMNRNDFLLLSNHATSFVKNLEKMKNSMSLVITKVNNCDPATGKPVQDQAVIEESSRFLKEASQQMSNSIENRRFIEHLLNDKSKWALVRYPSEEGPLKGMQHFVQVRQQIREICRDKLRAVPVTSSDFAITLSSDSKYIIVKRLIPYMRGEIDKMVIGLISDMETKFFYKFQQEIQNQECANIVTLVHNLEEICKKLEPVNTPDQTTSERAPVTDKIVQTAQWLKMELAATKTTDLKNLEEKLHLFQQVTEETDAENGSSVAITQAFNSLKTKLDELYKSSLKMVKENTIKVVEAHVKEEAQRMVKHLIKKYQDGFWSLMESGSQSGLQMLEKLKKDMSFFERLEEQNAGGDDNQKLSLTLQTIVNEMEIQNAPNESFAKLEELENELDTLLKLTGLSGRGPAIGVTYLADFRSALRTLRTEARERVRNKDVKLLHDNIHKQVDKLLISLEETFFNEKFYAGLNMNSMVVKRQMLNNVLSGLQRKRNLKGILENLEEIYQIFGTEEEVSRTEKQILQECEDKLDAYDNVLGSPVARPIEEWLSALAKIQKRIGEMAMLYEFLELNMKTNPNLIEETFTEEDGEDVLITKFLEALRANSEIYRIVQQTVRAEDKHVIKNIAKYLMNGKTNNSADGEKLVVKGRNVKFSDFLNDVGLPKGSYGRPVSQVIVLSSDTVHLDRDVMGKGKQLTIMVIASKWVVQGGAREIQLSGSDGLPHHGSKAQDGREFGENGDDGLPGDCGGNAGNFFGIYKEVANAISLSIHADGGDGADGQAGGDGHEGSQGKDAKVEGGIKTFGNRLLATFGAPNQKTTGTCGGKGGNGGDGGVGGAPGYEGVIKLFPMTDNAAINTSSRRGRKGQAGRGGSGAQGGKHGNDVEVTSLIRYNFIDGDQTVVDNRRGTSGKDGETGGNDERQRFPEQTVCKDDFYRSAVEMFRSFITEDCQDFSTPGHDLLQLINRHPDIHPSSMQKESDTDDSDEEDDDKEESDDSDDDDDSL